MHLHEEQAEVIWKSTLDASLSTSMCRHCLANKLGSSSTQWRSTRLDEPPLKFCFAATSTTQVYTI
eukprot:12930460-Prorocentrum_lima.AAC.1